MPRYPSRSPDLALPVASLAAMRRALADRVGEDDAAHALRAAGHAAGDALAGAVLGDDAPDGSAQRLGQRAFFRRLSDVFATRGWGHMSHADVHPGVGMLETADWVEANPDFSAPRPSCFFTTGMLANVLGRAAGSDVAVLEAECRSRGDVRCRFLFGAPETLNAAFDAEQAGATVDQLVAALD